jgi:putative SOS response-associated peptidase YedK
MCGRFTLRTRLNLLLQQFAAEVSSEHELPLFGPRYNIAPTQEILAIRPADGRRVATMLRWGLVPSWAKDIKSGAPLINARADTLANKPTFRTAFRKRRCLIPADGFYEWQKVSNQKQPSYVHRADNRPFVFAGLWERWDGGPVIDSCTIVTTDANKALCNLHDRTPVILAPSDYGLWLDPDVQDPAALSHLTVHTSDRDLTIVDIRRPAAPKTNIADLSLTFYPRISGGRLPRRLSYNGCRPISHF